MEHAIAFVLGHIALHPLDARSDAEFLGARLMSKRGGHIPTACHLEWNQLVDPDGRFLDDDALRAKLAKAGVDPREPVITHCQGGGRAAVMAFGLELMGAKQVSNYYKSWGEWGNADDTPVVTPPPKRK